MNKAGKKIVIPSLIWDFQRPIQECIFRPSSPRSFGMRGIGAVPHLYSALQTCAMTKCVARGFTLIELLVVVLIIGILAAVALAQYQHIIERSKAMQARTFLKAVGEKGKLYYLENRVYPSLWANLEIDLSWKKTSSVSGFKEAFENEDWILEDGSENFYGIAITRKKGIYKGGGLMWFWSKWAGLPTQQILWRKAGKIVFLNPAGQYCKKLLGGTELVNGTEVRYYTLP